MKRIQMENTNRCQAMNSPRGEMKLTHHLKILVLPNLCFTEIYYRAIVWCTYWEN